MNNKKIIWIGIFIGAIIALITISVIENSKKKDPVIFKDKDTVTVTIAKQTGVSRKQLDSLDNLYMRKFAKEKGLLLSRLDSAQFKATQDSMRLVALGRLYKELEKVRKNLEDKIKSDTAQVDIQYTGTDSLKTNFVSEKSDTIFLSLRNENKFYLLSEKFVNKYSFHNIKFKEHEKHFFEINTPDFIKGGIVGAVLGGIVVLLLK